MRFALVTCSAILGFFALAPAPEFAWAQAQAPAPRKATRADFVSSSMATDVVERIEGGLKDHDKSRPQIETQLEKFKNANFNSGKYQVTVNGLVTTFDQMPQRHPLLDTEGVADTSKKDYTQQDSQVLLDQETFGECLEERQVTSGPYVEECRNRCPTGLVTYTGEEETSCLPCAPSLIGTSACRTNQFYVSELYWPVYESRTYPARAMGSFDPNGNYLSSEDRAGELGYRAARVAAYDRGRKQLKQAMKEYYNRELSEDALDEALPEDLWYAADYTGRDLDMSDHDVTQNQSLHTLVYMTNANRQLSRRFRPGKKDYWKGYVEEDRCFFNTLPDPKKLAVSHATYNEGHDKMTFAYNHREVTEPNEIGPTRGTPYGYAMLDEGPAVSKLMASVDSEWRSNQSKQPKSTNNWMLGQYVEMNRPYFAKGMGRVGVSTAEHWQDWMYHSFFRLYNSRNANYLTDPLYASVASGFSFYTLNSLNNFPANLDKEGKRRPPFWTFYAGRPNGRNQQNYTGGAASIGPGKIFSVDKIQVIAPTHKDKGSRCFRPESLAREEYFDPSKSTLDDKIGTQNFWGFRRDINRQLLEDGIDKAHNRIREVRIAYWEKRVNCHCTVCSRKFYGCSVLNTGDHPDDNFYGTTSLENTPPVLEPGGSLNNAVVRGFPLAVARAAQPLADGSIITASGSADEELGSMFHRVVDSSIVPGAFNPPRGLRTRLRKAQQPKTESNARKIAMKEYGGHAMDSDPAAPSNTANGDEYAIGQKGPDTGTPGKSTPAAQNPLQGAAPGGDIPVRSAPPPKWIRGLLAPPIIPPPPLPPLICPRCVGQASKRRLEKCANGVCSADSAPSAESAAGAGTGQSGGSCRSGNCSGSQQSGECGGGGGGGKAGGQANQQGQQIVQQILGQLLGSLLGTLISGGGAGANSSAAAAFPIPSVPLTSASGSQPTAAQSFFSERGVPLFGNNRDAQSYRDEQRYSTALSDRLRTAFDGLSSPQVVSYRQFGYNQVLDSFAVDEQEFVITRSFGDTFGCLDGVCDYELAGSNGTTIASRKTTPTYRICIRDGRNAAENADRFECWKDESGLVKLGKSLLSSSSLEPLARAELYARSLEHTGYRIDPSTSTATTNSVCSDRGCIKFPRLARIPGGPPSKFPVWDKSLSAEQNLAALNDYLAHGGATPPANQKPKNNSPKEEEKEEAPEQCLSGTCANGKCPGSGGSGGSQSGGCSGGNCSGNAGGSGGGIAGGGGLGGGLGGGAFSQGLLTGLIGSFIGNAIGGGATANGGTAQVPTQTPQPTPTPLPTSTLAPIATPSPTTTPIRDQPSASATDRQPQIRSRLRDRLLPTHPDLEKMFERF